MKYQQSSLFFGLLFLAILNLSCKQSSEPTSINALSRIDLESDFRNDSVKVEFDSQSLFVGRVTTDHAVSAAWTSSRLDITAGIHTIKLTVYTDSVSNQISTKIQDTVIVAVRYERQTKQINFQMYNYWLMRE
jgi:hypothetical protein